MLLNLKVPALLIGFFVAYIIPVAFWYAFGSSWFGPGNTESGPILSLAITTSLILCPVAAGYLAARLAQQRPLIHGLLVSLLGATLFALMSEPFAWKTAAFWALAFPPAGITGAWIWSKSRASRQVNAL